MAPTNVVSWRPVGGAERFLLRAGSVSCARVRARAGNGAGILVGCPRPVVVLLKIGSPMVLKILCPGFYRGRPHFS
jgi:hypothetical protein